MKASNQQYGVTALLVIASSLVFGFPASLEAQQVVYGDVYHVRNSYGGGSYLDSCGHAQCTSGTLYGVMTHSKPDRDGVGTGKWKILSATSKTAGQALVANEEVYLQNVYGGGSYLDTCGTAQCTSGTRYGVMTNSKKDRDGVGTGKWAFQAVAGSGLSGTYELQGSNGSVTLGISDGPDAGNIRATLVNYTVDGTNRMKIVSMDLDGRFSLQQRSSEDFYLFVLHGEGTVQASNGTSFPATFSVTGFRSTSRNAALTTQWAAAYEFPGNAEGVNGGVAAWPRRP